jgi:phytoene/squalene synthetase
VNVTSIAILDHRHFEPDVRARLADIEGFVCSTRDVARDRSRTPEQRQDSLRDLENRMVGGGEAVLCLAQAASKEIITERFRSWSELISWAGYAAAPLGRQVLRLHDQDMAAAPHMESLYSAYCILSHVANCGDDFRTHGRVYIPADWLRRAGADSDCLAASSLTPELRAVLDQVLDGVDRLLAAGRPAAGLIAHRRLKLAVLTAQFVALAWSRGLRRRDPLAAPVAPSAMDRRWAAMRARWSLVFARSARRVPARAEI